MLMTERIDKINLLSASIRRINLKLYNMRENNNCTSPEYHQLRKEVQQLKKQRTMLEHECYGLKQEHCGLER